MSDEIKAGKILIADPYLQDGYFNRSVVLLTSTGENDTMGFILNKPSNVFVHEVFEDFPEFESLIYLGGPVDSNLLFFVHRLGDLIPNSTPISKGLYFGGDFDTLTELLNTQKINENDIRFFLGYSGWSVNQLNEELNESTWLIIQNKYPNIFEIDSTTFWKNQLMSIGGEYQIWANAPINPELN